MKVRERILRAFGVNSHLVTGVIVVTADARVSRQTEARSSAIVRQLRMANVDRILITSPDGRTPSIDGTRSVPFAQLAAAVRHNCTIFVWSDQYHFDAEWATRLLAATSETDSVVVHEGCTSKVINHLRIRGNAIAASTRYSEDIASRIVDGLIDVRSGPATLASNSIPHHVIKVNPANVASLYKQAASFDLPISFVVETNSSCNYFCYMCPYHGGRQRNKPTYVPPKHYENMDFGLFQRVVNEITSLERPYEDDHDIMITPYRRGEFLLYPHWRDALKYIKSKPRTAAYFSSNGSLWTDDDIEFVLDVGLDRLQISIEGHDQESHKLIRMNDEYEKVANTVRRIIKRRSDRGLERPILQLAHTVNERNFGAVPQYVNYWLNKADLLFIGPENYADDSTFTKRYKDSFSPVPAPTADLRVPCSMIKDNVWVDADGTVILCIGSKQTIIGDIKRESISEVLSAPRRLAVVQEHMIGSYDNATCRGCEQWYSAYGEQVEEEDYSAFLSTDSQVYFRKRAIVVDW